VFAPVSTAIVFRLIPSNCPHAIRRRLADQLNFAFDTNYSCCALSRRDGSMAMLSLSVKQNARCEVRDSKSHSQFHLKKSNGIIIRSH
jgi:hypothetical protein